MREPDLRRAFPPVPAFGIGRYERRAWRARLPEVASPHATLASWILECPHLHPVWSYWLVSLVHLRDVPGVPAPTKKDPTNEHEICIFAFAPDHVPDPDDREGWQLLRGPCVVEQISSLTDAQAMLVTERCVELCVEGRLSPDDDYRRAWKLAVPAQAQYVQALQAKLH
jgi:hypothetical protein